MKRSDYTTGVSRSLAAAADTLLKPSAIITVTGTRDKASVVHKTVELELEDYCHVTEMTSLLAKVFPVDKTIIERVYDKVGPKLERSPEGRPDRIIILRPVCGGCGICQERIHLNGQLATEL